VPSDRRSGSGSFRTSLCESLLVFTDATAIFARTGGSCVLCAALFRVPDLSMPYYLAGRNVGSMIYNAAHWYGLPFACLALGVLFGSTLAIEIGLIWSAHVGLDRTAGYGLKYASGFGHTHLGPKGNARKAVEMTPATI